MRLFRALPYAACLLALSGAAACGAADTPAGPVASATAVEKRIEVTIVGSTVTPAPAQVELGIGQTLELVVTSDHDDALHAHGFEVEAELEAGQPEVVQLTGTEAGVFEVETHEPALTVLTVAVR
jgi:ABC-type phosphate transport system substrate-binding protein